MMMSRENESPRKKARVSASTSDDAIQLPNQKVRSFPHVRLLHTHLKMGFNASYCRLMGTGHLMYILKVIYIYTWNTFSHF